MTAICEFCSGTEEGKLRSQALYYIGLYLYSIVIAFGRYESMQWLNGCAMPFISSFVCVRLFTVRALATFYYLDECKRKQLNGQHTKL